MNALHAGADGQLYDPLGGLPDLKARRVRFIGSARERIREDYLRILRFFRFTAAYSDGPPDAEGLDACIEERGGLARLSAERIRAELLRIFVTRNPMHALKPMAETGLLIAILGGVVRLAHFERLTVLEAQLGAEPEPIRRLGALALLVEEDAARLAVRLRLSNAEAARLEAMAALEPLLSAAMSEKEAREALYRIGIEAYRDRVLVAWARSGDETSNEAWRRLHGLPERWTPPAFPLKGQDLIARGFKPGPDIGRTLHELEAQWIASDFALSRNELLAGFKVR
jgi:tRNA nucleotidyltransferase/poly(A) polymerase